MRLAGAATASRSHAQSTVNLVVLSSSARSYGTRGIELWDDSQGRGEGYDVARARVSTLVIIQDILINLCVDGQSRARAALVLTPTLREESTPPLGGLRALPAPAEAPAAKATNPKASAN